MAEKPRVVGMMRVKNEARWIERAVRSVLAIAEEVVVLDDHSTDNTVAILRALPRVRVIPSPFEGLDEQRDKNFLLIEALADGPDWIVHIDGDEEISPTAIRQLPNYFATAERCISLRIRYLWNREDLVRTDGIYDDFHRESVFRPDHNWFQATTSGSNFHCGNVPLAIRKGRRLVLGLDVLHYGYLYREDRERKFHWYNERDPGNSAEDGYRHIVIGDLFPPDVLFLHGGPLKLERYL